MFEVLRLPRMLRNVGIEANVKGNRRRRNGDSDQPFEVQAVKLLPTVQHLRPRRKLQQIIRQTRGSRRLHDR